MSWLSIILAYLLGSVPTGYIAGQAIRGVDIRRVGDANVGAANVYRQVSAPAGFAVFLADVGKGILAILFAHMVQLTQLSVLVTGVAVVAGHNWPLFLGFRGGRGLSTTIGVLLVIFTQPMLIMAAPALLALLFKKNVSLASAVLFIPLPLICWKLDYPGLLIAYSAVLPGLVGFTHFMRARKN